MRPLMTAAAACVVPLLTDLSVCISACLYKGGEAFCANHENKHANTLENAAYRFVSKSPPTNATCFLGGPLLCCALRWCHISTCVCVCLANAQFIRNASSSQQSETGAPPHIANMRERRCCDGVVVVVVVSSSASHRCAQKWRRLLCSTVCEFVLERERHCKKLTFDGLFLSYRFVCLSAILRLFW